MKRSKGTAIVMMMLIEDAICDVLRDMINLKVPIVQ